ncbi:MAG: hypothetical protein RLZZ577_62 [Bacteroidota bacterium]|jgi:hypothetical protein
MKESVTNNEKISNFLNNLHDDAILLGDSEILHEVQNLIKDICLNKGFCMKCFSRIEEARIFGEEITCCNCNEI